MALTRAQGLIRWLAHKLDMVVLPLWVLDGWAEQVTVDLKAAQNLDNLKRGIEAQGYDQRAKVRMEVLQTIKDLNSPGEG